MKTEIPKLYRVIDEPTVHPDDICWYIPGQDIKFAGPIDVREGQNVTLYGEWVENSKYGKQFSVTTFEPHIMRCPNSLAKYLSQNTKLKGVGPAKAHRLIKICNGELESILQDESERNRISILLGIPVESMNALAEEWEKDKPLISTRVWLAGLGLTERAITKLIDTYGPATKEKIESNPYKLCEDVDGWGFSRADKVATFLGIEKTNPERLSYGLLHCLRMNENNGHTWMRVYDLIEYANFLLDLDTMGSKNIIRATLEKDIKEKEYIYTDKINGIEICALNDMKRMEDYIIDIITWASRKESMNCHFSPLINALADVLSLDSFSYSQLNEKQKEFINNSVYRPIYILSGGAGTGKTFAIKTFGKLCEYANLRVKYVAPTGKAARRIEESTGYKAETIHRLLQYNGREFSGETIDCDILVIDEFSMVDIELCYHLFRCINFNRTSLVIVGDHNQLPSVGPGAILRDLVENKMCSGTILNFTMRQGGELKQKCASILDGHSKAIIYQTGAYVFPKLELNEEDFPVSPWYLYDGFTSEERCQEYIVNMIMEGAAGRLGERALMEWQVITPQHKGCLGTKELNRELQSMYQRVLWKRDLNQEQNPPRILLHDKVIQTRNNYDLEVFNGTIGIILETSTDSFSIQWDDGRVMDYPFDLADDLELAYALTIHKVQGSEFPVTIVVCHKSHQYMLYRNLTYTAVTRAKNTCMLIGDRWGITTAIRRIDTQPRRTFLSISNDAFETVDKMTIQP